MRCIGVGKHPDTHRAARVEQAGNIDLESRQALTVECDSERGNLGAGKRGAVNGPKPTQKTSSAEL